MKAISISHAEYTALAITGLIVAALIIIEATLLIKVITAIIV